MPYTNENRGCNRVFGVIPHCQIRPQHMHRHDTEGFNGNEIVNWDGLACGNVVVCISSSRSKWNKRTTVQRKDETYIVRTLRNPIPIPTQSDNLYNSEGTVIERGISTAFNLSHARTINLYTNGRRISTRRMSRIRITNGSGVYF